MKVCCGFCWPELEPSLKQRYVIGASPPATPPVKFTVNGAMPEVGAAVREAKGKLSVTVTL